MEIPAPVSTTMRWASRIPDFRGPQGMWTKNLGAEKMATLQHYVADPEVRKRAWRSRRDTFARQVDPNTGHRALVDLERRGTLLALLTQNVDGLHQAAGSSPEKVVEIHGTIREVVCLDCGERAPMERALARTAAMRISSVGGPRRGTACRAPTVTRSRSTAQDRAGAGASETVVRDVNAAG